LPESRKNRSIGPGFPEPPRDMRERLFSTAELGRLLSVSEATVKRWADTGRIGCFRTPGGHRKFRICDISSFVEATGYEVTDALTTILANGRTDRAVGDTLDRSDLSRVVTEYAARAIGGDVDGVHRMITCLQARGICLAETLDRVVAPAFSSIGDRWERGELTVVEEHVATNSTVEALGRLADSAAPAPGTSERLALAACLEGERHDLGARAAAAVLEGCGYRSIHVGANTPIADLETHLESHPTHLLVVSSKAPPDPVELGKQIEHLAGFARRHDTALVLGGDGFSLLPEPSRTKLTIVTSCRELVAVARNGEATA
jgi:excisionase family DNA binding protein